MGLPRSMFYFFILVIFPLLTACGGGDHSGGSETVSMSEQSTTEQNRQEATRSTTDNGPQNSQSSREKTNQNQLQQSQSPEKFFKNAKIYPTKIKRFKDKFVQLTLNEELTIKSIQLPKDSGGRMKWPSKPGDDQREESVIWFEDGFDLRNALNQTIESNTTFNDNPPSLNITAMRANKYQSGSLRGFMDITFNDKITVKGAKLMKSDGSYWVAWPSKKGEDGNYYDFVSASKQLKNKIKDQARDKMGY